MDWMQVSKAQFDQFRSSSACMWGIKKVTIPPSPKTRLANATIPRNMTSSTVVTPTPMIDFSSASPDVKDVDSSLVKQTPPKSPAYHAMPKKQQFCMTSSFKLTKAHLVFHVEERSTTLHLV